MSGAEKVAGGYTDIWRLFGKNEPHPRTKKHVRLIFGTGIVDQLCYRLVFGWFCEASTETWDVSHFAPGMGVNDPGLEKLFDVFRKFRCARGVDGSSWDWHVTWYHLLCAMLVVRRCSESRWFQKMAWRMMALNLNGVILLPDGRLVVLVEPGLMFSGWFLTSHVNTIMAVIVAKYATTPLSFAYAAGDDTVLDLFKRWVDGLQELYTVDEVRAAYRAFGQVVKDVVGTQTSITFCSLAFDLESETVQGLNASKILHSFCSKKESERDYDELLLAMRLCPEVVRTREIILECGLGAVGGKVSADVDGALRRWGGAKN
jgi:hypothetical protein